MLRAHVVVLCGHSAVARPGVDVFSKNMKTDYGLAPLTKIVRSIGVINV